MITTMKVRSMEQMTANSVNAKTSEDSNAGSNDFQDLLHEISSVAQQEKQEEPVVNQDSREEKKDKQEVQELMPGEVIPLLDLQVEKPVNVDHLQEALVDIPIIPEEISRTNETEISAGVKNENFSETTKVNPNVVNILMEEQPNVLQTVHNESFVDPIPVNEAVYEANAMILKGKPDHTESIDQQMFNQLNQTVINQTVIKQTVINQTVNENPKEVIKAGNTEIASSLPKAEIQPKTDKVNQEALVPKSQISTTQPHITEQKAAIVEKSQSIFNPVDIQQASVSIEKNKVEGSVAEEVLLKGTETTKLKTDELQTTGTTANTEEREVDLSSVLQQEKTGLSPFKEDVIKVKLAEPFNQLNAENVKNIADKITESINNGRREFHIQMDPENLGKIQVKISLLETGIKVTLSCESQKTYQLLAERASGINQIVEQNTGSQSIVEVKEGYWNQQKDATDQHAKQQGQERQQQEKASKDETNDFIQQMRLGFFDKGLVV